MHSLLRATALSTAALLTLLASPAVAAKPHTAMERLTVSITKTGSTVWGRVSVSYRSGGKKITKTCSAASCSYSVAKGTKVTLKETPHNAKTWPFSKWTVSGAGKMSSMKAANTSVTISGKATVTAVYVVK